MSHDYPEYALTSEFFSRFSTAPGEPLHHGASVFMKNYIAGWAYNRAGRYTVHVSVH